MRNLIGVVLVVAFCGWLVEMPRNASADEKAKKDEKGRITFDVVLESVDVAGNTITAKAYQHVIPPSGSTGGVVYHGHLPPAAKPTRFERLPVMPEAGLQDKKLRPGMRVTLMLDTIKTGVLVVTAIEQRNEPERIGIDWLDAPTAKSDR